MCVFRDSIESSPQTSLSPSYLAATNVVDALQSTFLNKSYIPSVKTCITTLNPILLGGDPNELKAQIDTKRALKLLQLALSTLETGSLESSIEEELKSFQEAANVFVGLYDLLFCIARDRIDDRRLNEDLKKMYLAPEIVQAILFVFAEKRASLEEAARQRRVVLAGLQRLDWRVDVAISSAQLNRVFKPTVTFQMTLDDGRIRTFESSVEMFNQLRHKVASMLASMQNIEQHPTLKRLID